jgi:predicted enzyme related to lactoylglutathione lyase
MEHLGFLWAGVLVEDMAGAISFYRDVLGLPLLDQGEGWAHFEAGHGALLELMSGGIAAQAPKRPDEQSIVLGLRVTDLERASAELELAAVHLGETGAYGNTRWVHLTDPEGNQLEIKQVPSTLVTRGSTSVG